MPARADGPERLIAALRRPETYPEPVDRVEIRQTHISVVALAGPYAYKVKKAVSPGFLDFTTLDKRHRFCREEVRLNRRLAPGVYLGVVPIVEDGGRLVVEGEGEPVEWAVKMRRLPDDATLLARLTRGEVDREVVVSVARRIAGFHAQAASSPEIDEGGALPVVAANARDNLEAARGHVGECLSATVAVRLGRRLEEALDRLGPLIEERAERHVPRDTHGDLHLAHVYLFPDRAPPGNLIALDCIEFDTRFRYADPVADVAFLAMDLAFHGRRDLADVLVDAYFEDRGDAAGRELIPFYVSYRAAVRAKVEGIAAHEQEIPEGERRSASESARAHWLLALSELESPDQRPGLVLVGGLPGMGKSTVAQLLARGAGFRVVSSDQVRKELAGIEPSTSAAAGFGEGIYTSEWNDRTYDACLQRVSDLLFEGERVVVDASFREARRRAVFLEAAVSRGVRCAFLHCRADAPTVRERLASRRGDASDATWSVHRAAAERWEEGSEGEDPRWLVADVATDGTREAALRSALIHLHEVGLASSAARDDSPTPSTQRQQE